MASCGRDEAEVEAGEVDVPVPKPKPGSCCASRQAHSAASASAASGGSSSCGSGGCASKHGGDQNCCSTQSSSSAGAAASSSTVDPQFLVGSGGIPPPRSKDVRSTRVRPPCHKCRASLANVILRENVACSSCFSSLVGSRIKAALRTRCALAKGANLLVAVSGGAASTCLAQVMSSACDPHAQKRMFFGFDMVYVDESAVFVGTEEENAAFQQQVQAIYAALPQKLICVKLEDVMSLGVEANTAAASSSAAAASSTSAVAVPAAASGSAPSNRTALQSLFSSLRDASDKGDLRDFLRLRLLGHVARTRGHSQVVLGDNATRTAVDALADTTKGRGATVPFGVLPKEDRFQVEFLYPLRDISASHIALYNHYCSLAPVFRPSFVPVSKVSLRGAGGINQLAHDFLHMLDAKFHSSVSNIVATVGKVDLPPEFGSTVASSKDLTSHCSLCGRPRIAAEYEERPGAGQAGLGAVALQQAQANASNAALLASIPSCYGCAALMRELSSAALLPPFVLRGPHADLRASAYPAPFNAVIGADAHRARNATLRAEKVARQVREAQQKHVDEDDSLVTTDPTPTAHASSGHEHQQAMHLQSRQEMKASINEFLLTDAE